VTIEQVLAADPHWIRLVPRENDGWIVDYDVEVCTSPLVPTVTIRREQELTLF
jgi:hypothetical protein